MTDLPLPDAARPALVHRGDAAATLARAPAGCADAVVSDPPYGLEFMGKQWDSFGGAGWRESAGFAAPGIGDRKTPWPAFGGRDNANATCAACGGRMRGKTKCGCETPDWVVKGERLADGFRRQNNPADAGRDDVFDRTTSTSPEYRAGPAFQAWCGTWAAELFRVLKPGGYAALFGGTRTYHRLAVAVEDAGFEIRDCLMWMYGSGFPKHKSCLKPAYEPILLARKPGRTSTPLNVDDCRVETWAPGEFEKAAARATQPRVDIRGGRAHTGTSQSGARVVAGSNMDAAGRWPPNVLHDGSPEVLDAFARFGESA